MLSDNLELKIYKPDHKHERDEMKRYILDNYDPSWDGISSLISALDDNFDYVIVLSKNNIIKGALSYFISNKHSYIEVDHIGVVEHNKKYGTKLMLAVFKIADILNKKTVSLVTNGSSNEFYEKVNMYRANNKTPAVYEITIEKIRSLNIMGIIIRFHV
jgi:hypothetical protein